MIPLELAILVSNSEDILLLGTKRVLTDLNVDLMLWGVKLKAGWRVKLAGELMAVV